MTFNTSLRSIACTLISCMAIAAQAQLSTFAGNAQHTNVYNAAAANINQVLWQTPIDTSNTGAFAHYGEPLVTANNTVIVPVLTTTSTVLINAFSGATGALKYTLNTDYVMPSHGWIPSYEPVIVGTRLYYPGDGGTIYYVDNIDGTPTSPTQVCFYGLPTYQSNAAGFNSSVFVDTPITADSQGNIFFGFRVEGTPITPFFTNANGDPVSGYARIGSNGATNYAFVNNITSDSAIIHDSHNCAPALSNDESTVYVLAKSGVFDYAYICGLDTTTLSTKFVRFVTDPRPGGSQAGPLDDSTSSPVVGPDGDVYMGMFVSPYNGSRGYLAHYSGDLSQVKTPGAFGWDFTPGIVPSSMVPGYSGKSSYLLFCKYNNYTGTGGDDGGDGINTVAILDPNDETQVDWHPSAAGMVEMREVLTMIGCTPDAENPQAPNATREWCVNATVVNPSTDSVFFNSEDGRAYRWNLGQDSLTQALALTTGFGEPYVPSCVGPNGTVYTLNGTYLFAMGPVSGTVLTLDSNKAEARTNVVGDFVQFTAHVTGGGVAAGGTITFTDTTYDNFTPVTTTLGTVTVTNQQAVLSTNALQAGIYNGGADIFLGSHFITASYSGDANHPAASITRVQKVHWYQSSTSLQTTPNPVPFGQPVQMTATVVGPAGSGVPTGMVTFTDGSRVVGQKRLDGNGVATVTVNGLGGGNQNLGATYVGDTEFASSAVFVNDTVQEGTTTALVSSQNPANFGQPVTFTATVSPVDAGAGVPSGAVTFNWGGSTVASVNVDSNGVAKYTTSSLPVGEQDFTATFSSTSGWGGSTSATVPELITDGTSVSLGSDINPSTVGQTVTFNVTVFAADSGAGIPQGDVTLYDGTTALGTQEVLHARNDLQFQVSTLSGGSHNITASLVGFNGWQNSTSPVYVQVVNAATNTAVSVQPSPSIVTQQVTITATVTPSTGGGTPTGSVAFTDNGANLGSANVDASGHASITTSTLGFGNRTIAASFTGSNGWQNSSGQIGTQVQDNTTTTVASSQNPGMSGQPITFTATVASNHGVGTPTGVVSFTDNGSPLGNVPVDGTGHAALTISTLSLGGHTIGAAYAATGTWLPSSGSISETINDGTPPSIPQNVAATAGPAKGQVTIHWSASNDPDDAVNHYEVWKSNKINGSYTLLTTVTTTSVVDSAGHNQTRFYFIIAVDSHGNKSAASAKVSGTGL